MSETHVNPPLDVEATTSPASVMAQLEQFSDRLDFAKPVVLNDILAAGELISSLERTPDGGYLSPDGFVDPALVRKLEAKTGLDAWKMGDDEVDAASRIDEATRPSDLGKISPDLDAQYGAFYRQQPDGPA